jgi:predicted nucleic acid-binding protein
MELKYLWDTNTVICYLQKNFPPDKQSLMSKIINDHPPAISAISQIEILCWKAATENDIAVLNSFISDSIIFELEQEIKLKTIEIRKSYNIKLPDAIIASTAIVHNLTLITTDKGFNKIGPLKLLNLFEAV